MSTATNERPLICVLWRDSASTDAWMAIGEAKDQIKLNHIWTTGWVIAEDFDRLLLSASHGENWEQVGEVIAIPKALITVRWYPSADPSVDDEVAP